MSVTSVTFGFQGMSQIEYIVTNSWNEYLCVSLRINTDLRQICTFPRVLGHARRA
jgi:hypothetical protein